MLVSQVKDVSLVLRPLHRLPNLEMLLSVVFQGLRPKHTFNMIRWVVCRTGVLILPRDKVWFYAPRIWNSFKTASGPVYSAAALVYLKPTFETFLLLTTICLITFGTIHSYPALHSNLHAHLLNSSKCVPSVFFHCFKSHCLFFDSYFVFS